MKFTKAFSQVVWQLTWSESSVKLKNIFSSQLFSHLTDLLPDSVQFYFGLIQNTLYIRYASHPKRIDIRRALTGD